MCAYTYAYSYLKLKLVGFDGKYKFTGDGFIRSRDLIVSKKWVTERGGTRVFLDVLGKNEKGGLGVADKERQIREEI